MEGFQGEDRHNPLPHIGPSTTALNSVYEKTASLSTHLVAELRELQVRDGLEWQQSGQSQVTPACRGIARSVFTG
jgi:hypothetical protein